MPAGRLGVTGPEDDHLALLEEVLDRAVELAAAGPHAVAPVVLGAPGPTLPTVGIVHHARVPDGVEEAPVGAEEVPEGAPGVVRAVRREHRAGAVLAPHAHDLAGDDIQGFIPADALVAGDATGLGVTLAVRVEVDALHRVEQAVRRVHRGPGRQGVWRQAGLARRGETAAARRDGPRRRVVVVELDGRHAHDLAALDIHEDRAAVGVVRVARDAAAPVCAVVRLAAEHSPQDAHHPARDLPGTLHPKLEALGGLDAAQVVGPRAQHGQGGVRRSEDQACVGVRMDARTRRQLAVAVSEGAARGAVGDPDLQHAVPLAEQPAEAGVGRGAPAHQLREPSEQGAHLDLGPDDLGHATLLPAR